MYVAARAMWDPSIGWEDTVRHYCERYFGDVAKEMAANRIRLENEIYGKRGYYDLAADKDSVKYIKSQRSGQIKFLKGLIAKTKDPLVKMRLGRELKPWVVFGPKAQHWAYPEFDAKSSDDNIPMNVLPLELRDPASYERPMLAPAGSASSQPFYLSNRQHHYNIFRKPLIRHGPIFGRKTNKSILRSPTEATFTGIFGFFSNL